MNKLIISAKAICHGKLIAQQMKPDLSLNCYTNKFKKCEVEITICRKTIIFI